MFKNCLDHIFDILQEKLLKIKLWFAVYRTVLSLLEMTLFRFKVEKTKTGTLYAYILLVIIILSKAKCETSWIFIIFFKNLKPLPFHLFFLWFPSAFNTSKPYIQTYIVIHTYMQTDRQNQIIIYLFIYLFISKFIKRFINC